MIYHDAYFTTCKIHTKYIKIEPKKANSKQSYHNQYDNNSNLILVKSYHKKMNFSKIYFFYFN